jgi:anhydro-N-acetylmuramic acid kinase
MMEPCFYAIGLMSGTSMDGIDAALMETDGTPTYVRFRGAVSLTYTPSFARLLKALEYTAQLCGGDLEAIQANFTRCGQEYAAQLGQKEALFDGAPWPDAPTVEGIIDHSTRLHAKAVQALLAQSGLEAAQVSVVGYHGQTLYHNPSLGRSLIVGDGKALAALTGIDVVNDFRRADLAAGGQGAPFAPLYHQALALQKGTFPAAFVNCGGIANITFVPDGNPHNLMAFDTGPGNALIDRFVRQRTHGRESMDQDGRYGLAGQVDEGVLAQLYAQGALRGQVNMLTQPPPKALDSGDVHLISALDSLNLEDGCATLAAFTARTLMDSLRSYKAPCPRYWFLAGGGWKNPTIYQAFRTALLSHCPDAIIQHASDAHWRGDSLEAELFAYLAVRHVRGLPLSYPGTTGVPQPLCGGVLHRYVP